MKELAGCPALSRLRVLDLEGNVIDDTDAVVLAHSPHLGNVTVLHLDGNRINEEGPPASWPGRRVCPGSPS
jgi:hypothetical protein